MNPVGGQDDLHRERLLQELLDGTLRGERREAAMIELQADPNNASELVRLRAALDTMRDDPQHAPDFSPAILDELGRRQGFLAGSMRIFGSFTRVAAVLAFVATLGALAILRERGEGVISQAQPRPVTQVVDAMEEELTGCMRSLTKEARAFGEDLTQMPEQHRCFRERMTTSPKPRATETDTQAMFMVALNTRRQEDERPSVGSARSLDLRVDFDHAGDRNASHATIWVVGSGSRWNSGRVYTTSWPTPQASHQSKRTSSFGIGKDAGYP